MAILWNTFHTCDSLLYVEIEEFVNLELTIGKRNLMQ